MERSSEPESFNIHQEVVQAADALYPSQSAEWVTLPSRSSKRQLKGHPVPHTPH
ncbi:hypothetical protein P7K49_007852 [Saguinus oedipus]|uniref:Uncharacterized protein n=1 Tax=Saguinus oedipus TaxID=9490 RepID=A0ABQ9VWU3_SAGOE|nr:hypothetical protein P7K49_007852 [Saguinus oedipus]